MAIEIRYTEIPVSPEDQRRYLDEAATDTPGLCQAYGCAERFEHKANKRYCSRTCQNREQKARWRRENFGANMMIRTRESIRATKQRSDAQMEQLEAETGQPMPRMSLPF